MTEENKNLQGESGAAGGKGKPPKQVHIDVEEYRSAEEIGRFLVDIGQKLAGEGAFTLTQGGQSYRIAPSGQVELEIQYKSRGDKHTFEVEIEWRPGREGGLQIE